MHTIKTRYLGATNVRGARIKATDIDRNTITTPYDASKTRERNYVLAALAFCKKMKWTGYIMPGYIRDGMIFTLYTKNLISIEEENKK